jgi:hypothetical protein
MYICTECIKDQGGGATPLPSVNEPAMFQYFDRKFDLMMTYCQAIKEQNEGISVSLEYNEATLHDVKTLARSLDAKFDQLQKQVHRLEAENTALRFQVLALRNDKKPTDVIPKSTVSSDRPNDNIEPQKNRSKTKESLEATFITDDSPLADESDVGSKEVPSVHFNDDIFLALPNHVKSYVTNSLCNYNGRRPSLVYEDVGQESRKFQDLPPVYPAKARGRRKSIPSLLKFTGQI